MLRPGDLREVLVIQENVWPALVATLTRVGTVATATTSAPHTYQDGDYVTVAGATPAGYNGRFKVTVTGAQTFTYAIDGSLATPATGAPTATFTSDAQGGRRDHWTAKTTIRAALVPFRVPVTAEALQLGTVMASELPMRFRARRRADLAANMRASWTPSWPPASAAVPLEIHLISFEGNGVESMFIDCAVLQ